MMPPRALFGVAIRILAVWFFTQGAYWCFWAAVKQSVPSLGNPTISVETDLVSAAFYLAVGAVLMFLADPIAWRAYGVPAQRRDRADAADEDAHDGSSGRRSDNDISTDG
jgi:hypothetical protein